MKGPDRDGRRPRSWPCRRDGSACWPASGGDAGGFQNTLRGDHYALFFAVLISAGAAFTLLMSVDYLREQPLPAGEFHALVLLSTAGMVYMAAANDLIVIFLALEVMSMAVYVLAGMMRNDGRALEAAVKYFLLGAFASAFLLYGIAFLYGATGSTRLDVIAKSIATHGTSPFVLLGIALLLVGFGFKVAVAPFHVWTPDVYEGSPTVVTAFMAVGVKAAGFAAFARVFLDALHVVAPSWSGLLWVLAALTMTIGNVTAVTQRSVKRMLAYSSIAHAGYLLVGLVSATRDGGAALLFYLVVYTCMNLGAFGVLLALGRRGEPHETCVTGPASASATRCSASRWSFSCCRSPACRHGELRGQVLPVQRRRRRPRGPRRDRRPGSLVSVYYYLGVLVQMYMAEGGPTSSRRRRARSSSSRSSSPRSRRCSSGVPGCPMNWRAPRSLRSKRVVWASVRRRGRSPRWARWLGLGRTPRARRRSCRASRTRDACLE